MVGIARMKPDGALVIGPNPGGVPHVIEMAVGQEEEGHGLVTETIGQALRSIKDNEPGGAAEPPGVGFERAEGAPFQVRLCMGHSENLPGRTGLGQALVMAPEGIQSVGIAGSGAVGLFYGARLARAGVEVRFLMRRDLAHARMHGIQVRSCDGDFQLFKPQVGGSGKEMGRCDLVLVTAKTTQTESLLPEVAGMLGPDSILVSLQNGLGAEERLAQAFPHHEVHRGVCFVCLNRTGPAEVTHLRHGAVGLGAFQPKHESRIEAVAEVFRKADLPCHVAKDLETLLWKKLVWNVPFNGLGITAGGVSTATLLKDRVLRERARRLMAEVMAAGRAHGCVLEEGLIEQQFAQTEVMGDYLPSSVLDYREGRPVEVEAIWSEPLRRARASGVAVPELERLEREIRQRVAGAT